MNRTSPRLPLVLIVLVALVAACAGGGGGAGASASGQAAFPTKDIAIMDRCVEEMTHYLSLYEPRR